MIYIPIRINTILNNKKKYVSKKDIFYILN